MVLTEELIFNIDVMLSITDNLTVRILDTVLSRIKATAPITARSHNLRPNSTLVARRLSVHRRQRMIDVFANRMLRPLHSNKILISACAALHHKPVNLLITLVLVTLDKVPAKNEVLCNIVDTVSDNTHSDIVPWHTAEISLAELIGLPFFNRLEVHDAVVVEVLAGENLVLDAMRMDIGETMLVVIPATEAQVQTTNEGESVVDDDEFLMVSLRLRQKQTSKIRDLLILTQ